MSNLTTFGAFLRARREARGWTQPEAAAKAGIEQSYLSKLELGKSAPSPDVFQRLAETFQFDAVTLAAELDEPALAALGELPAVCAAVAGRKARTLQATRSWLIAGLVMLLGAGASGGLVLLQEDTRYEVYVYQSPGVIADGEDLSVYEILQVRLSPEASADNDVMAAQRQRQADVLARSDVEIRRLRDLHPEGFAERVDGGRRYFTAEDSETVVERSPLRWLAAPALMFLLGALGCFFISFRWR